MYAPRAFSLKLATVTRNPRVGLVPTTFDAELEVKHRYDQGTPKLVLMIAKHVDDIKVTGEPQEVELRRLCRHRLSSWRYVAVRHTGRRAR